MLNLPMHPHPVRDLVDLRHLAVIGAPENRGKLAGYRESIMSAKRAMQADKAIRAVNTYCLRADGEFWLMRVGPRGGVKKLWNFGKF